MVKSPKEMFMAMLTQLRVWPSWAHTEEPIFIQGGSEKGVHLEFEH